MRIRLCPLITALFCFCMVDGIQVKGQSLSTRDTSGRTYSINEDGNSAGRRDKDSTKQNKQIPKGLQVWTIDRQFGDITPAKVDTMPHLYPQSTLPMGAYMQYNCLGNNYSARQNRIFNERRQKNQFAFTDVYDMVIRQPEEFHFTNTLSPITNLSYDNCGNKTDGEDHLDAKFAVNAGKRIGIGMDLDYSYARGYYQNQSISHFGATFYASYLGDRYQLHALYSTYHQKTTENGGITDDNYITHPELTEQPYSENEIPTMLQENWNRNNHQHLFLTHRYSFGFYRHVPMTEEEIEAKKFALLSAKANSEEKKDSIGDEDNISSSSMASANDSILTDSASLFVKREYVPVTSFFHTMELNDYDRRYQVYNSPENYYLNTYYDLYDNSYSGDSIKDCTKFFQIRNTVGIALLEGFNKYIPSGLKIFAAHELRNAYLPMLDNDGVAHLEKFSENNLSIGGQLQKTQGRTLHYNVLAETWIAGEDAGQLKVKGSTDVNFAFWGDTVRLAANASFHRTNPTFYERKYHSKHFWWDNSLDMETRTRIGGDFSFEKTKTTLRIAIEEIQNYTYYSMSYTRNDNANTQLFARVRQHNGNLNIITAQLEQKIRLGIINWDNILTYQNTSNKDVLPLPTLNVFSNLYLQFMIAKVLRVELGASATWFSKYYAPDFCPAINQFAVQENSESRVELGNFPFIDVYANLHLKHARFFLLMQNATASSFNQKYFLVPHYPMNAAVLHFGVSWNFFN